MTKNTLFSNTAQIRTIYAITLNDAIHLSHWLQGNGFNDIEVNCAGDFYEVNLHLSAPVHAKED